jgi:hypothetical protein
MMTCLEEAVNLREGRVAIAHCHADSNVEYSLWRAGALDPDEQKMDVRLLALACLSGACATCVFA